MFPREDFITCFISLKGCDATSVYCRVIFCPAEISTSKATFLIHWTEQLKQLCRQNKPYLWHLFRKEDSFSWNGILVFACLISTPFLNQIAVCQKTLFVLASQCAKTICTPTLYLITNMLLTAWFIWNQRKYSPWWKGWIYLNLNQPKTHHPSLISWFGGLNFHSACITQIHTNWRVSLHTYLR